MKKCNVGAVVKVDSGVTEGRPEQREGGRRIEWGTVGGDLSGKNTQAAAEGSSGGTRGWQRVGRHRSQQRGGKAGTTTLWREENQGGKKARGKHTSGRQTGRQAGRQAGTEEKGRQKRDTAESTSKQEGRQQAYRQPTDRDRITDRR
ncbi:hypothetical protein E2C01_060548 [Portunus trituberculatus]|uniref:Uncharacterized protein n=1 Tax=Portunus trituberculatus TaxID=210409 RepID=A0A5B7H1H0_PORTR|nr:hypothetical protein [Portunus trituberculatus]